MAGTGSTTRGAEGQVISATELARTKPLGRSTMSTSLEDTVAQGAPKARSCKRRLALEFCSRGAERLTNAFLASETNCTFVEYLEWWFDGESDAFPIDEVVARVQEQPCLATQFHTTRWVAGERGFTFEELLDAIAAKNSSVVNHIAEA